MKLRVSLWDSPRSSRQSLSACATLLCLCLLTPATAVAQLGRLPIGSPDEVRDYYLTQVRQVLVYVAPVQRFRKGTNAPFYPFRCAPATMDELVGFTRRSVVSLVRAMNGEGLQAGQPRISFNAFHDTPWTLIVTANAEVVFPAAPGSAGTAPILFESGPWYGAEAPTNHAFFLEQHGTNWLLPTNIAATIDFPVIVAGGQLEMYVRVPRGRQFKVDVEPGGPVERIYERKGSATYQIPSFQHITPVPRTMAKLMTVADSRDMFLVKIPGPLLYQKYGWTLKVWLEDAQGNPLEQDFYPTGELKKTWRLKPGFFAHQ
ncbi:MAG: hypothetical protein ACYDH9_22430 [Limisphaerales bacterium]